MQDLERTEQKIFQQYNSDGAFETLLGLGLIVGGMVLSHVFESIVVCILPVFLVLLGRAWKKRITYPRLGYVELAQFRQKHRTRHKIFLFAMLAATAVFVIVMLLNQQAGPDDKWDRVARFFFVGVIGIIVVGAALFRARQAPILYLFVAAIVIFVLLTYLDIMRPATWLLISGGAFAIYGLIKLVRFLRDNPPLPRDTAHDIR
ncbi:MAG: hypothetical protein PHI18_07355 [bacterium]|nr:hypothetical protein [bacterium]